MNRKVIIPASLNPGDRIVICSPAGIARRENVEAAIGVLCAAGYDVELSAHAYGMHGSFSGTVEERFADLRDALLDPEVKAIICSRGGYGAVHLLDKLNSLPLQDNAKWLIGFSDISALHALMSANGIASIHGPMAKHISANGGENADFRALHQILSGRREVALRISPHPLNRYGEARGRLAGGNFAVLQALIGTPLDVMRGEGVVLLLEDINEPIYKVERMMWQLRLNGVLERLAGLIVGQFVGSEADRNYGSVEEMIRAMVEPYGYPVAFGAPIGHGRDSRPVVISARSHLQVAAGGAKLTQQLF